MDSRWFKEDRALPKNEQAEAVRESEKALKASTLLVRRLKLILEDEIQRTYRNEEDYARDNWQQVVLASAARRKTLKEVINLLP